MIRACSHLVVATDGVERITRFFEWVFEIKPYYEAKEFSEFVLPNQFRIAFFKPVGKSAERFDASASRKAYSFGITVDDVDKLYKRIIPDLAKWEAGTAGEPKDHPWGERSFLLIDPDGNRFEITKSPSEKGMLVNRESK